MRIYLLVSFFIGCGADCYSFQHKESVAQQLPVSAVPKKNAYEKLFAGKKTETVKGLFTLHKQEGKILFEIPVNKLGRTLLLASAIAEITDNSFGSVGEKPYNPQCITFVKQDSAISFRKVNTTYYTNSANLKERLAESNLNPVIRNYEIKAYTPDSSAVVIDFTDYLTGDTEELSPFNINPSSALKVEKLFKRENASIGKIRSFSDNFSIRSSLSYTVTTRLNNQVRKYQEPFTAVMARSFILLPEIPMRPRFADPRIGLFSTGRAEFTDDGNAMKERNLVHRWRLEPKDPEAYRRGELVEPVKPVIFYVDNAFPENWKPFIRQGIEQWQQAFEKIGFKNAVIAQDFPVNDPEFDPENIKYATVRYSPSSTPNAMGPSWVDPRTGEILNATVSVYHNLMQLIRNWRFIQTSAADADARVQTLPLQLMGESLRYAVAHEVGHTLGLMHNMGSSAAIPTDSLRSASFTRKNGTSYSIMDYARYNYVAQPGDKERGVRLSPPKMGLYDEYTIKWAYRLMPDKANPDDEVPVLNHWITEKMGDAAYRYGKQQFSQNIDPRSLMEDLGDDAVKSAGYGIRNLKYIMKHLNTWVAADDPDGKFRREMVTQIMQQYVAYMNHVIANIGGIYLNERYQGDPVPAYRMVPAARQKKVLDFLLQQTKDLSWIDNQEVLRNLSFADSYEPMLRKLIFTGLINRARQIQYAEKITSKGLLSQQDYLTAIYQFVFAGTNLKRPLKADEQQLQEQLISQLINAAGVEKPDAGGAKGRQALSADQQSKLTTELVLPETINGGREADLKSWEMEGDTRASFDNDPYISLPMSGQEQIYYRLLKDAQQLISGQKNISDRQTRLHYQLLLFKIGKALK